MPPTPLLPYVPPDITPTYTATASTSSSSSSLSFHPDDEKSHEPEIKQVPYEFEHRDSFSVLENFYAEPPMADVESYQAPIATVYAAREFEETWKPPPPPPPPPQPEEEEEEGKEEKSEVCSEEKEEEEEEEESAKTSLQTSTTQAPLPSSQVPTKSEGQGDEVMYLYLRQQHPHSHHLTLLTVFFYSLVLHECCVLWLMYSSRIIIVYSWC